MNEQTTIQELKSERVQKPELKKRLPRPDDSAGSGPALSQSRMLERLKSERVQSRLKRMQGWKVQSGGKAIDRVREFPDALVAASYLAFAALLARQSGQPLRVSMVGNTMVVALPGRASRPGLTEEVLDLAEQLG
jgi:pterin-4a-carbinolamine dehydratase